ncbi:MAG: alpha/beta fold hydrolase [Pseudomonadales bacterium]|jgi:S-formylglutathione hydrolase FrmB|nr:alpha/beta fold hydrolase [Pseudomonadales bacterium]
MLRSLLLLLALCLSTTALAQGRIDHVVVHATSLEGNLIGDSAERDVFIYLPPSYDSAAGKRYPVIYLLHGYGLRAERWLSFAEVEAGANAAIAAGVQEAIIVNPDAYNFFDGSMYSSSLATGDWEGFIAEELVAYVDTHYRTLATRESRGLAGHSMGGYGTLRLGMKYPEVFAALYPMSACCLMDSAEPSPGFATSAGYTSKEQVQALRYPAKVTLARAAAWSPNAARAPFYLDLPADATRANPDIQAKWHANSITTLLDQYTYALRRYTAIQLDVGTEDNLLASNQNLHEKMQAAGIAHSFETYSGDHNNRVAERLREHVLPFFSQHLQGQR